MGGFSFHNRRAAPRAFSPPKVPASRWPGQGALGQASAGLWASSQGEQEKPWQGWLSCSALCCAAGARGKGQDGYHLQALSWLKVINSVVVQWRSNSWETEDAEKSFSRLLRILLWDWIPRKAALFVCNVVCYSVFFPLFCLACFVFFLIQGPGHCFWTALSRTDT